MSSLVIFQDLEKIFIHIRIARKWNCQQNMYNGQKETYL